MSEHLHIALLGDSTIDNKAYVRDGKPVADHVFDQLRDNEYVTDYSMDGAHVSDVHEFQLPAAQLDLDHQGNAHDEVTHIFVSVGGNDALKVLNRLTHRADTIGEGIARIGLAVAEFEMDYRALIASVTGLGVPVTLCTIYNGDFPNRERFVIASAARMFNEVILQTASDYGLPVIDLRQVCDSNGDYYNPIEPSNQGGRKIAHAIYCAATGRPIKHSKPDALWTWNAGYLDMPATNNSPMSDDVEQAEYFEDEDGWPVDPTFTLTNLKGR